MSTEKKTWISDKNFFWLVLGISLVVPAVVVVLRYLPEDYRPNATFARQLPFVNAVINSLVSVCLVAGFVAIKKYKNKAVHQKFMLAAFSLSAGFLVSYVTYHLSAPHQPFCKEGLIKVIYLSILLTHIVLAAIILPLVLYTIYFSSMGKYEKHRKIARITFPLWLYVSITGVAVYVLISPCYQF